MLGDTVEKLLQTGLAFARNSDFYKALPLLKQAADLKPHDKSLYYHLGNIYSALGQLIQAQHALERAIQIDRNYPEAHNNLGRIFHKRKMYPQATRHYQAALEHRQHYEDAAFNLGFLWFQQGKYSEAKKHFLALLPWSSKLSILYEQLAQIAIQTEQLTEAAHYYTCTLELTSASSDTWNNAGVISMRLDQYPEALDRFTQALALNPKHVHARNNRAALYLKMNDFKHAIFDYTLYLRLVPQDSEGHYNLGTALMLIGRLDEAVNHLNKALEKNTVNLDALSNLAAIYLKQKNWGAAQAMYQAITGQQPNHPTAIFMLSALSSSASEIPSKPPLAHTKALFDYYAGHFDQHLQGRLGYTLPVHVFEKLKPYLKPVSYKGLDLGCGTGLVAEAFEQANIDWTGVDLSPEMLKQAKRKSKYNRLVEQDIESFLESDPHNYELVTCIDTLVYFGSLESMMAGAYRVAAPQAYFVYSVVLIDSSKEKNNYHLEQTGRYQHSLDYLQQVAKAQKWQWIEHALVKGRVDHGEEVAVAICILQKISNIN